MERLHVVAERTRIATNLVHRNESCVAVERRVLNAFGHDRAGGLLEPHDKLSFNRTVFGSAGKSGGHCSTHPEQQHIAQKVDEVRVEVGSAALGVVGGSLDVDHVTLGHGTGCGIDIGAVHRERGDHLTQHRMQVAARVVAVSTMPFAHLGQECCQLDQVSGQHITHHLVLLVHGDVREGPLVAGEIAVEGGERGLSRRVNEQTVDQVEEVVARSAGHRPRVGK